VKHVLALKGRTSEGLVAEHCWNPVGLAIVDYAGRFDRMKGGKTHRVPLSPAALAVLRELLPRRTKGIDLVFPGGREGKPLSDMAISEVVRRMNDGGEEGEPWRWRDHEGRAVVPHGFRATFKAWTLALGYSDMLSEMALAHADKDKVRAAYLRPDMLEPEARAPMMQAWAEHCDRTPARVVALAERQRAKR